MNTQSDVLKDISEKLTGNEGLLATLSELDNTRYEHQHRRLTLVCRANWQARSLLVSVQYLKELMQRDKF